MVCHKFANFHHTVCPRIDKPLHETPISRLARPAPPFVCPTGFQVKRNAVFASQLSTIPRMESSSSLSASAPAILCAKRKSIEAEIRRGPGRKLPAQR